MSTSAGSWLILGVELGVKATTTRKAVTRYDAKTGAPYQVEQTFAADLAVTVGGAQAPLVLTDHESLEERRAKSSYFHEAGWLAGVVADVVVSHCHDVGVKTYAHDSIRDGDFALFRVHGRYFLGRRLASSDNSGYANDTLAAECPVPTALAIAGVAHRIADALKLPGPVEVSLVLVTMYG